MVWSVFYSPGDPDSKRLRTSGGGLGRRGAAKPQLGEGTRTQQEDNRKRGQEVRNSRVRHIN